MLKRNVPQRNPETIEELIEVFHLECQNFSQELGFNIFSSLYNRIDLLIESTVKGVKKSIIGISNDMIILFLTFFKVAFFHSSLVFVISINNKKSYIRN